MRRFVTTFILAAVLFALPVAVFAQCATEQCIKNIISSIGDFVLYVGAALVVIFLILAGVSYLTAGGDETKISQAKSNLKWVVVGAVVIIGVQVILNTIQNIAETGQL